MTAPHRALRVPATRHLFAFVNAMIIIMAAAQAEAAITVTEAKIAAGRLIVNGTSDVGESVSLDGHYVTDVSNKSFSFSLVYVPASCIVSLGAPGTTTPNIRAVIANCAPMPVKAMGAWQADTLYQANDLVERQGGQYVALIHPRANLNEDPLFATSFWRAVPLPHNTADQTLVIGAKGERGEAGRDGAKGEDGALASMALHTIKADITRPPLDNGQPKGEWTLASSGSLPLTLAKDSRDGVIDLLIPTSTLADPDLCTLTATVFDSGAGRDQGQVGRIAKRGDMIVLPVRTVSDSTHLEAMLLCPKAK